MGPRRPTKTVRPRPLRGAILLEVIFSIALFAAACGTIIGGFTACIRSNHDLWLEQKAADLAVSMLSEIQMGTVAPVDDGPNDYLEPLENWCWQVTTVDLVPPTPTGPSATQVQITVTYKPEGYSYTLYHLVPSQADSAGAAAAGAGGSTGLATGGAGGGT